ncbi:tRNA pseudouridine(55) synthase [Candidatus Syntrophocurvum alkaliphilum]|uniref:tRNA pseudouridine synthase B n=1 Tax=Candidatus Syntrophocurvum alkaliphilum TaxID=2293317 RepID=A0A6I6D840_9FIRM|nr:tRNA pseudouridine(55) synthase TruB [Candidatus Syntrophocurvum alkaliphilum]QGT99216.1 tRNA pseudouridine(55) synthase [Candidatus Syntrophocurvum alkaliphilum]
MDGFININKPEGITSFDVLRTLKKQIGKIKMGHLGTLDPMATGVLPVALGNATRVIEYIKDETKAYTATMIMGRVSDTQDEYGTIKVIQEQPIIELDILKEAIKEFTGKIKQLPPMYSAVHHNGKRLYELAREGKVVERELREVEIYKLDLVTIELNENNIPLITIYVECSKGTYIRTLCHDIGQKLGTGAYLNKLIRVKSGIFNIDDSITLEKLEKCTNIKRVIKDIDYPLNELQNYYISNPSDLYKLLNGNKIQCSIEDEELVKVYSPEQNLVAIAEINKNNNTPMLKPKKVFK